MNDVTAGQTGEVRFSLRNKELNCFASVCVCVYMMFSVCVFDVIIADFFPILLLLLAICVYVCVGGCNSCTVA